ncbi:BQ2448_708 [Microbotryum intermedium]|uniref:BQ2448_708 protein n=1 Tax=Microbotryum intermedium TaxID=269621 RepID=A0A238F645_9BASI|nr:BQ2448_708 [Microbotryum intermedium]
MAKVSRSIDSRSGSNRLEDSQSDPLAIFHLPPPGETALQKAQRLAQEMEAEHISQQDRGIVVSRGTTFGGQVRAEGCGALIAS